jgi:hypothetical protein
MASIYCVSCGSENASIANYCQSCGKQIPRLSDLTESPKRNLRMNVKNLSIKGKIFYASWIFINIIFISEYFVGASKPVDRFRSLCTTENLNCAPSGQEMMDHALGNLIMWNLIFVVFRWIYTKYQKKRSN